MSGMDRLTEEALEALEDAMHWCEPAAGSDLTLTMDQGRMLHRAVCELLAHRRASQAAPAPSDGLREAWIAGRDAAASVVAEGWAENRYQEEIDAALIALTPPAAMSPAPAQEGGE